MKFVLTIETNDPEFVAVTLQSVRAERRVAQLVRQVSAELAAGWGPKREIRVSGQLVGEWEYTQGVTE